MIYFGWATCPHPPGEQGLDPQRVVLLEGGEEAASTEDKLNHGPCRDLQVGEINKTIDCSYSV